MLAPVKPVDRSRVELTSHRRYEHGKCKNQGILHQKVGCASVWVVLCRTKERCTTYADEMRKSLKIGSSIGPRFGGGLFHRAAWNGPCPCDKDAEPTDSSDW
jgi:hypothetical protein